VVSVTESNSGEWGSQALLYDVEETVTLGCARSGEYADGNIGDGIGENVGDTSKFESIG
jgi:hypothetical protein